MRAVRRADTRRARPRRRPRIARVDVRVPTLLPGLRAAGCRRHPLQGRSRSICLVPRFRPLIGAMGGVANTGRGRVLLHQLRRWPKSPRSTPARPERPSRCCPSMPGTRSSKPIPTWPPCCPTSRRSWFAVQIGNHERQQRKRSATWFRSTSATSSSVSFAGCGRDSTGAPRRTPRSMRSSTAFGPRRGRSGQCKGMPDDEPGVVRGDRCSCRALRRRADAGVASANHRSRRNARCTPSHFAARS